MKQITLIRHAKVDIENSQKIDSHALQQCVKRYDTAHIHTKSLPNSNTIALVKCADVVLTSTLRRTIDSASVLGVNVYESNTLFNEAGIPEINVPFLKLKPKTTKTKIQERIHKEPPIE